ncbi:hypothetical protein PLICRDRAFT_101518 [Plicaturopsis crispa FD-325 SS-3]|nr:hypothetical protein PLICRDRAFT_101518 [Plicaturopsis crispa FD-325 SS-3]
MPRENSFSDGSRSITPDLDDNVPVQGEVAAPALTPLQPVATTASDPGGLTSPTSIRSRIPRRPPAFSTPVERFRASVKKVIQLHRTSTHLTSLTGGIGAEPGIDPRRESAYVNYGHIRQKCLIEVFDYSSVRHSYGRMTNSELVNLMQNGEACKKDPWVKVRWINVGGVSWDVISAIALRYDLHPLALEDVLSVRSTRSKCDYYPKHLFLRMLCHTLGREEDEGPNMADELETVTDLPRSESPVHMNSHEMEKLNSYDGGVLAGLPDDDSMPTLEDSTVFGSKFSTRRKGRPIDPESKVGYDRRAPKRSGALKIAEARRQRQRDKITIDQLKKGERVNVKLNPMSIFLTRDGTVISFYPVPDLEFTAPITARLRQRDTGLRKSADPSLLVQSLLDLIVDQALEIVDEYNGKILKLEHQILIRPQMKAVRQLHIFSGDLVMHKRTLEPIKTVIYGLRRYDRDRAAALIDSDRGSDGTPVQGFISHKANIYLADVLDHMEFILTSVDMFAGVSENLINYTFNMASYEMNEVMRRLTLATIIFLPLTLLTGYFGMNFNVMPSVQNHSDILFWIIALPVSAVVIPMFTYPDFVRMWHYLKKKTIVRRALVRRESRTLPSMR